MSKTLPPLPDLGPEWTAYWTKVVHEKMQAYAIAATAPLLERIAELEQQLSEARKDAQIIRNQALEDAANVCDRGNNYDNPMTAGDCAEAIRSMKKE